MQRIAVIVAFNLSNCGMYSVDLSAQAFFQRLGYEIDYFCPGMPMGTRLHGIGTVTTKDIQHFNELSGYDLVVYWGDFTTNPHFGKADFTRRMMRREVVDTADAAFQLWRNIHMPPIDRTVRVMSVGQNFHTFDGDDPALMASFAAEYEVGFDLICPRDPVSLKNLTTHAPNAAKGNIHQGMDAAFLLHDGLAPAEPATDPYFVTYFGRSELENPQAAIDAATAATGLEPIALEAWLAGPWRDLVGAYERNSGLLRQAQFLLSDTYHCCVNAWTLHTPAVGIGRQADQMLGSLGDLKKQVLFEFHGEAARYVNVPDGPLGPQDLARVGAVARTLADGGYTLAGSMIAQQRRAFEARLADFVNA